MHRTPKALRAQFFGTAVSFREALGVRMPEMPIRIRTDCASIALRPICERRWISITTVVIIGGAFSGASTAFMLKRKPPEARVLIIDKTAAFDRKVGESTTEVSSCYMTRILGLTQYLGHHQLRKQGLRLWFSNRPDQPFDDCVEIGAVPEPATRFSSRPRKTRFTHARTRVPIWLRIVASRKGHRF